MAVHSNQSKLVGYDVTAAYSFRLSHCFIH